MRVCALPTRFTTQLQSLALVHPLSHRPSPMVLIAVPATLHPSTIRQQVLVRPTAQQLQMLIPQIAVLDIAHATPLLL